MAEYYYIYTTSVFNTLDKNLIYSINYDTTRDNVSLLATEPLTGFTREFDNYEDIGLYLNNQGTWYQEDPELRFDDEYIPSIDDET